MTTNFNRCIPRTALAAILALGLAGSAAALDDPVAYYSKWSNGVPADANFFPIAVWLQSTPNAAAYKAAGVNIYIGLWNALDAPQLSALTSAGMKVMCDQNAFGLAHATDKTIIGWTQQDEPDNAQANSSGGYDPPILPSVIKANYTTLKANDATRPVFLNLGQGVSYTTWVGRGTRTGHTEDYPLYCQGGDIPSFDIYPVNSSDAAVTGKLEYVPQGVDNLRGWSGDQPVWCWIECTWIGTDSPAKPTPAQTRSEVLMALIHGAKGIGYFCHSWNPSFDEAALLHDASMLAAVTALNQQLQSLAPVLNSANTAGATVASSNGAVPVDLMVKNFGGATYIFAAAMKSGTTTATFTVSAGTTVEVVGESRTLTISANKFSDAYTTYGAHIYKIASSGGGGTNHAPVASAQSVTTAEDTAKAITLAATDADGNSLTYAIVAAPAHGTLSGSGASRTYTPAANYHGSDSFTFKANDGMADSNVATVTLTVTAVNDAPTASAQSVSVVQDTAKAITLSGHDADGDALTYAIAAGPAHGALSGSGASRTYTPAAGYTGADSFTFTVNDGTVTSGAATVAITVAAPGSGSGGGSGGGSGSGSSGGHGCGHGAAVAVLAMMVIAVGLRRQRR